jgi:lipooligosaccharide transport system permease protein
MSANTIRSLPAIRSYAYWVYQYKRTWRGSVISTVVSPVLYLAAMGVGLGSLVHRGSALGGLTYLQFVGPGLLAATAMQVAAAESMYTVLGSFKWIRVYHAMAATPLTPVDILAGHLLWMASRIAAGSAVYLAVVAAFGGVRSPLALLALPACLLVGMAFAAPITAFSAGRDGDNGFAALNRFVIVPMFLFSGTFFPVSQLPQFLRGVAYATPLWHGVQLVRSFTTGHIPVLGDLGHAAYLLLFVVVGIAAALRIYRRKLEI